MVDCHVGTSFLSAFLHVLVSVLISYLLYSFIFQAHSFSASYHSLLHILKGLTDTPHTHTLTPLFSSPASPRCLSPSRQVPALLLSAHDGQRVRVEAHGPPHWPVLNRKDHGATKAKAPKSQALRAHFCHAASIFIFYLLFKSKKSLALFFFLFFSRPKLFFLTATLSAHLTPTVLSPVAPPCTCTLSPSQFIRYLLGRDFPNQRIGPEPTTDRFTAVIAGPDDRTLPGAVPQTVLSSSSSSLP